MTGPLHLVRTDIGTLALAAFAAHEGLTDDDLGYALHLALRRRFGPAAPQPFRLIESKLFGYTSDPARLADAAIPDPMADWQEDGLAALFRGPMETRQMPSVWASGQILAFDLRVRPVIRYGDRAKAARAAEGHKSGAERDAFLSALDLRDAAGPEGAPRLTRETVYADWLAQRLDPAARLRGVRMVSYRRTQVVRSLHKGGRRRLFEGPETILSGTLCVADPAAFSALLARGIGRHTAFGFGMLLLRPAAG